MRLKYPLQGAYLKAARAHQHFRKLKSDLETWFEGDPYHAPVEEQPYGWQLFRCEIREYPPLHLGVTVGDIAHNARSALDHLAWELVKLNRGKPGQHTGFPIYWSRTKWNANVKTPYFDAPKKRGRKSPLHGVSRPVYDHIEKLQPYNRGTTPETARRATLAQLAWLNNADKHRALHVAFGVTTDEPIGMVFDRPELVASVDQEVLIRPGQFLEDGLELMRVRVLTREDGGPEEGGYLNLPVGIVFSQEDGFVGYPAIIDICNEVVSVIGRFDLSYFEGAGGAEHE